MDNLNQTTLFNEDILTITEDSSETTSTGVENEISILKYEAVPYQDGIDIVEAKKANAKAFKDILDEILPAGGTIKIPEGRFLLSESIAVTGANYIKIVNEGVLEADPLLNSEVGDDGPVQKPVFQFLNCKEVYYEGGTIQSNHESAEVIYSPKGHNRVANVPTTMRTGISSTGCEKVEIKNATFSGLEYAILLMTAEKLGTDLRNVDVTIGNITVTETAQPIFVSDTHNVTIENVDMISRAKMSSGDHFIYCSRNVDNVYIGGNNKFEYSDYNYGCAINLRNADETTDSVKLCTIDNVEVTNMYRQFVSAKADTRIICNNCKVTTRETIVNSSDSIPVFFVGERASIDIINCTVEDKIHQYMLTSLYDDVQVNISGGKFTGLNKVGKLAIESGNEMNSIRLNVSSAEIETVDKYLTANSDTKAYFYPSFNNCNLFTSANYYFQSQTENCKIACYNCEFNHYSDSPEDNRVPVAYLNYGSGSVDLLDNIKIINCKGYGTKGVSHFGVEGKSTTYGNYFSYTENGVTKVNSTCVHEGSITLNMLSPELQAAITPLLTTS